MNYKHVLKILLLEMDQSDKIRFKKKKKIKIKISVDTLEGPSKSPLLEVGIPFLYS